MKLIGAIIMFLFLSFVAFVVILLSGGIRGAINNLTPPPIPQILESKRTAVEKEITNEQEIIKNQNEHFKYYDKSEHDYCNRGQNNWKVQEGYATKCAHRVTYFYGFNGDFKQTLLNFENYLGTDNWIFEPNDRVVPPEDPNTKPIEIDLKFYDEGNDPSRQKYLQFPNGVLVSDLGYLYNYKKNNARLYLRFAEKATKKMNFIDYSQEIELRGSMVFYDNKRFIDSNKIFNKIISSNRYLIMISIEKVYFEN